MLFRSISDLTETITEDILGQLALEGYIKKAMDFQKVRKGKGKPSEPLYAYVADDQKLLGHFFRPELDMGYYVSIPRTQRFVLCDG